MKRQAVSPAFFAKLIGRRPLGHLCCALLLAGHASVSPARGTFQLSAGVVVDPAKGYAYVVEKDDNVAAVNLTSGNELWKSDQPSTPIATTSDALITQSTSASAPSQLQLKILNPFDGSLKTRADVSLPLEATPSVSNTLNLKVAPTRNEPTIVWEFTENRLGGAPRGSADDYLGRRSDAAHSGTSPPSPRGHLVSGELGAEGVIKKYGAFSLDLSTGGINHLSDTSASDIWAQTFEVTQVSNSNHLPSADGANYVVSQRLAEESYRWKVYSTADNKLLGQVTASARIYPFFVTDNHVVYDEPRHETVTPDGKTLVEPRALRAFDLKTGQLAWSKEVKSRGRKDSIPP